MCVSSTKVTVLQNLKSTVVIVLTTPPTCEGIVNKLVESRRCTEYFLAFFLVRYKVYLADGKETVFHKKVKKDQ